MIDMFANTFIFVNITCFIELFYFIEFVRTNCHFSEPREAKCARGGVRTRSTENLLKITN
jgi:hypothetical protein